MPTSWADVQHVKCLLFSLKLMFERLKIESLRDVGITRIGDTLSYGFPQTEWSVRDALSMCILFLFFVIFQIDTKNVRYSILRRFLKLGLHLRFIA